MKYQVTTKSADGSGKVSIYSIIDDSVVCSIEDGKEIIVSVPFLSDGYYYAQHFRIKTSDTVDFKEVLEVEDIQQQKINEILDFVLQHADELWQHKNNSKSVEINSKFTFVISVNELKIPIPDGLVEKIIHLSDIPKD
jgi:hypothetical protein